MQAKRPAAAAAAPLQAPDGEDCESARQELLWEQFRDRKRSVMERLGAEEAALEAVVKKQKTEQGGAVALPAVSSRAATFDLGPKQFGRLGYMGGARGAVAVSKFCGETVRAGEQNGAVSPDCASYVRSTSQTVMRAASSRGCGARQPR